MGEGPLGGRDPVHPDDLPLRTGPRRTLCLRFCPRLTDPGRAVGSGCDVCVGVNVCPFGPSFSRVVAESPSVRRLVSVLNLDPEAVPKSFTVVRGRVGVGGSKGGVPGGTRV